MKRTPVWLRGAKPLTGPFFGGGDPVVIVSVENEILGSGEFWRGPASLTHEVRNICGREIAQQTAKDGQTHTDGMWRSRLADPQDAAASTRAGERQP